MKGYVWAKSQEEAIKLAVGEQWYDIIDTYEVDALTEGYEVIEIWETQSEKGKFHEQI